MCETHHCFTGNATAKHFFGGNRKHQFSVNLTNNVKETR